MTHDMDSEPLGGQADFTAAVPLEIDEETAARTDDLLREFAEDAGLETVLVVDRSGALVAGISSEADVTVEIISALVAGASGAMRALVARLGETGSVESLHFGGNRLVYLKETVHRFILVAVAEAARPAGLVRQKALSIEGALASVLSEVRPAEAASPIPPPASPAKSLRDLARERAERRAAVLSPEPDSLPPSTGAEDEEEDFPFDPEPDLEEAFAALDLRHELEEDSEALESREPREIHEPIDFGEPEIVIEPSVSSSLELPVDSPFEEEEGSGDDEAGAEEPPMPDGEDAVFESFEDEEELPVFVSPPPLPTDGAGIFVEEEDEEREAERTEESSPVLPEPPASSEPALPPFEEDEPEESDADGEEDVPFPSAEDGDDADPEEIFEFDEETEDEETEGEAVADRDPEDIGREIEEMIAEEDEESEIRSAGPFYF